MENLLKEFSKKDNSEQARQLSLILKNGEIVPDSLILRILKDKLNTTECKRQGWCMVGVPTNMEQVNMMKDMM